MSSFQPVRGTHDLLPDVFCGHKLVKDTACNIAARYGFREMMPPVFEFTQVFSRTMGESSDVVAKEMYTFAGRSGEDQITLRPEFTAGICRAFASNALYDHTPFKVFATGPLFRYERPQKGRQRQFHQIDVERQQREEDHDDLFSASWISMWASVPFTWPGARISQADAIGRLQLTLDQRAGTRGLNMM